MKGEKRKWKKMLCAKERGIDIRTLFAAREKGKSEVRKREKEMGACPCT